MCIAFAMSEHLHRLQGPHMLVPSHLSPFDCWCPSWMPNIASRYCRAQDIGCLQAGLQRLGCTDNLSLLDLNVLSSLIELQ